MIPINFSDKRALVTGVGDSSGFAWAIAKYLNAAGAKIVLAVQPNRMGIVQKLLVRYGRKSLQLPDPPGGELRVEKVVPCDVSYDNYDSIDERGWEISRLKDRSIDFSIAGAAQALEDKKFDMLIHSVAFSPEIMKPLNETSRQAYLTSMNVSAYSLSALCQAFAPHIHRRKASIVGLTYLGGERVAPLYGGGMASAKAALQIDCRQLAYALGAKKHRVNLISAGAYPSRAGKAVPELQKFLRSSARRTPLRRNINRDEVAAAALFLCSPLATGITGEILFVDGGYNTMAI